MTKFFNISRYEEGLEDYDEAMENLNKQQSLKTIPVNPLALLLNQIGASFMNSIQPSLRTNPFASALYLMANGRQMMDSFNRSKTSLETTTVKVVESKYNALLYY